VLARQSPINHLSIANRIAGCEDPLRISVPDSGGLARRPEDAIYFLHRVMHRCGAVARAKTNARSLRVGQH